MENLSLNEYQNMAMYSAIYPRFRDATLPVYPILGLNGEAGEVAEKVKKIMRDKGGIPTEEDKLEIAKELGDTLWYLAAIAKDIGWTLEDVGKKNLDKLSSRKERGALGGSGDNR